jgi:hypothetical protein
MKYEVLIHYVFKDQSLFNSDTLVKKDSLRSSPLYAKNAKDIDQYVELDNMVNESLAAFATVSYYRSKNGGNCLVQILFNSMADKDTSLGLVPEVYTLLDRIRFLGDNLLQFSFTSKEGETTERSPINTYEDGILIFNASYN